uniref:CC domain-containing protein n=1 Tax=Panagrellus redivivus TaxID=6233 RepID=A0A7E4VSP0_PANRE
MRFLILLLLVFTICNIVVSIVYVQTTVSGKPCNEDGRKCVGDQRCINGSCYMLGHYYGLSCINYNDDAPLFGSFQRCPEYEQCFNGKCIPTGFYPLI